MEFPGVGTGTLVDLPFQQEPEGGLLGPGAGQGQIPCFQAAVFNLVADAAQLQEGNAVEEAHMGRGGPFHVLADGIEALPRSCPSSARPLHS